MQLAALSKKFTDKFGEEVTSELVALLNAADSSYRQEFRELFAANFGQLRAEMDKLRAEMDKLRAELRAELRLATGTLGAELRGELQAALAHQKAELTVLIIQSEQRTIRWVIGLWLAGIPAMAAVIAGLRQLGWL